jgi:hypothetical protein
MRPERIDRRGETPPTKAQAQWKENSMITECEGLSLVLLRWDFLVEGEARGVDSAGRAMYFQRVAWAVWADFAARAGEEGGMVKYIAVASYWLGVVCSVIAVVARICDAMGIAFVHILTKGNNIDFRSFLDAGLLFLFIAIASANYEGFNSRQRGS